MKKHNPDTMIMAVAMGFQALLLGGGMPAYAQREQRDHDAQSPKQEQQARPEKQQHQAGPARQEQKAAARQGMHPQPLTRPGSQRAAGSQALQLHQQAVNRPVQHPAKQQVNARPAPLPQHQAARPSPQGKRMQQGEPRGMWQQHRAHNWLAEHRTWQQRGGYTGDRIPEEHFRGYFGRGHGFRVSGLSMVLFGGNPRFQYGGYWFRPVDPWPEYWADNWYQNDDVYIDYSNGGYYLFNGMHPGVGVAISVTLH